MLTVFFRSRQKGLKIIFIAAGIMNTGEFIPRFAAIINMTL